jgi:DICT domain-containing protein
VTESTPFELISEIRPVRTAPKSLLISLSRHLENQGLGSPEPPVVLATFRRASYLTTLTRARYAALAERAAFTGLLGPGMAAEPVPRARGVSPPVGDPIRREWDVIVVTPHFTGALVASDHFATLPEPDRRFSFRVTYDRDLVLEAARTLLGRICQP